MDWMDPEGEALHARRAAGVVKLAGAVGGWRGEGRGCGGRLVWLKHAGAVGGWCGPEACAITRATSRGSRSLRSAGGHMDWMD